MNYKQLAYARPAKRKAGNPALAGLLSRAIPRGGPSELRINYYSENKGVFMTYKQAAQFIIERRKAQIDNAAVAYQSALLNNQKLLEADKTLRALILTEAKGQKVNKKEIAELETIKTALLKQSGIILNPPPLCKKCDDTAFVNGAFCACVKALVLNDSKNIGIALTDFKDIDYKKFDPAHVTRNKAVYEDVQRICEKYPDNKRRIITILGSTGTGKTLLAGCAANALMQKGFTAVAVTAFGFVDRALKYHTTFDEEKSGYLEPILEADILIIDDLGTESILKNVTHEYLYTVIAERILSGKITFITSNLSQDGILARYGERIYSRLFDKNLSYHNILGGKDLRV